jgi:hypothetical protein
MFWRSVVHFILIFMKRFVRSSLFPSMIILDNLSSSLLVEWILISAKMFSSIEDVWLDRKDDSRQWMVICLDKKVGSIRNDARSRLSSSSEEHRGQMHLLFEVIWIFFNVYFLFSLGLRSAERKRCSIFSIRFTRLFDSISNFSMRSTIDFNPIHLPLNKREPEMNENQLSCLSGDSKPSASETHHPP